jgi:drug/metabolite transporter (DMT)-like permease
VGLVVGDLDLTPPLQSLFWLAVLGLTSQSLGYLFISISLPRLPAVVTSLILLVQPVVSVGLSMVLLGERPSPAQLAGVGLVVGGIAVATIPIARLRDAIRANRERAAIATD